MFRRLWVRITAPYTGCTFFTYICCINCNDVCLKRGRGEAFFKSIGRPNCIQSTNAGTITLEKSIFFRTYLRWGKDLSPCYICQNILGNVVLMTRVSRQSGQMFGCFIKHDFLMI